MDMPRIDRLHLATLTAPDRHPAAGLTIEVFAFLVRYGGLTLLVDTGMGDDSPFLDKLYNAKRHDLTAALAEAGARLSDIDAVANSHLHFDHCGNNKLFPHVPIYVQAPERAAAQVPLYTVTGWAEAAGTQLYEIDGDHRIAPGLTLLSTPGHTPGHQSLLVETDRGPVVIGAQAAYSAAEFQAGGDIAEAHEGLGDVYRASIGRLKSFSPTAVYFSHDRRVWGDSASDN